MSVVNQTLMAELAYEFNLGADILSKGNRKVEKLLSADKCSGDTVNVDIMDNGIVYDNLDISNLKGKLAVRRGMVPVRVTPVGTAAEASAEQLTLAIKNPQIMAKRVANLQDEVNKRAFFSLVSGSQAFVAEAGATREETYENYGLAMYDADAHTTASKFSGETYGIAHPQSWNRLTKSMSKDFGANNKIGNSIYKNELGPLLGHSWTKGMVNGRITGVAQGFAQFAIGTNGFDVGGVSATVGGSYDGEISQPVTLSFNGHAVQAVDALGKPTGENKTVYFRWSAAEQVWHLAQPIFFEGPRKNAHQQDYEGYLATYLASNPVQMNMTYDPNEANSNRAMNLGTLGGSFPVVPADVLTENQVYLQPLVMWKEPDFLIAVKGIQKQAGPESYTIPTEFSEKGILPLRGSMFTDPWTDITLFRADALMGFGLYQGVSVSSIYLPV